MTPVFIIGCGRSGTNWLARILDSHPSTACMIEKEPVFTWTTNAALCPELENKLYPEINAWHKETISRVRRAFYIDKSHPALWFAERLANDFPEAKFITVHRDMRQVVASILRHNGSLRWFMLAGSLPVPCRFLGIMNYDRYKALPAHVKAYIKYKAHRDRVCKAMLNLGNRLLTLDYNAMVTTPEYTRIMLSNFLNCAMNNITIEPKTECLTKWENTLTEKMLTDIQEYKNG